MNCAVFKLTDNFIDRINKIVEYYEDRDHYLLEGITKFKYIYDLAVIDNGGKDVDCYIPGTLFIDVDICEQIIKDEQENEKVRKEFGV